MGPTRPPGETLSGRDWSRLKPSSGGVCPAVAWFWGRSNVRREPVLFLGAVAVVPSLLLSRPPILCSEPVLSGPGRRLP